MYLFASLPLNFYISTHIFLKMGQIVEKTRRLSITMWVIYKTIRKVFLFIAFLVEYKA